MKTGLFNYSIQLLLAVVLVLMSGMQARASYIRHDSDDAEIWLYIASWVEISFDDPEFFFLDIEAGDESAAQQKWFTARTNCAAQVTGLLTPPPTAPAGIIWEWSFQPGNTTFINMAANTTLNARVKVHPKGNDIDTIPAGLYKDGVFHLMIDALNPEPSTAPFPQP